MLSDNHDERTIVYDFLHPLSSILDTNYDKGTDNYKPNQKMKQPVFRPPSNSIYKYFITTNR